MKRVLMLGYFFPPSKAAGTFRTLRFVRHLPSCGWRPQVLTVTPSSYPSGDLDPELLHKVPNETDVRRTPAPPLHRWFKQLLHAARALAQRAVARLRPRGFQSATVPDAPDDGLGDAAPRTVESGVDGAPTMHASRSLSQWLYTLCRTPDIDAGWYPFALLAGIASVLRQRPDVLYATGGPWMTFVVAADLSRLTGLPLVLDYRDPWSFNPAAQRGGRGFERYGRWLEARAVRRSTRIVANTDVLRDTLVKAFGAETRDKIVVINNSFEEDDFRAPPPAQDALFTFSYVGSLYDAHSPEPFLRALAIAVDRQPATRERFRVRLVGTGAPRTARMVREMGLDDIVQVQSPVSHAEAIRLQRSAHALLLFLTVPSDDSTFVPSKLFEYVAARRPIFTVTRGGALERLLRGRQLTRWIHDPDDLDGIATGILDVLEQHERNCLPSLADATVSSFSGAAATRALAGVLDAAHRRLPTAPVADDQAGRERLESIGTEAT